MKLGLVTTTIHVPEVLRYLRAMSPTVASGIGVRFFVAGDLKSPHDSIQKLCTEIDNAVYIHPYEQRKYKCSEAIGWNSIQRRNIATLEALRWGATHIYSWDTDNIPMSRDHFTLIKHGFETFHGPMIWSSSSWGGWIDTGQFLCPPVRQRGIPDVDTSWTVTHITDARIGVVAGACLGDPDISAVDRISSHPEVHAVHELVRAGAVIDPLAHTVFNSQNTCFIRELAPAMFMLPHVGRYDDIFASLICRRVMREHNYHLRFGKPFTWQERNGHNLLTDLTDELVGMTRIQEFADAVARSSCTTTSPLAQLRAHILPAIARSLPSATYDAYRLWLDDVEQAMSELPL